MSRADASYISRRRLASSPALDIEVDDLDFFADPASPAPAVRSQGTKAAEPTPAPRRGAAPDARRKRGRWLPSWQTLLGLALFAIGVGSAAGLAARARDARKRAHAAPPLPALPAGPSAVAPPAPSPATPAASTPPAPAPGVPQVPVVDVATLPRPHDGVVTGSPGHRLWIDGTLAPSWKVSLPCGPHVVRVGSAGVSRTVDVPCGSVVMVSP